MKTAHRIAALVLLVALILGCLTGCSGDRRKINGLLAEFQRACNSLDIDSILECIDPRTADVIKLAVGLYGLFSDQDTGEALRNISEALIGGLALRDSEFFLSIKIDPKEIRINGEEAIVSAAVQYTVNGETYDRLAEFLCVDYLEKWYISRFDLQ